MNGGAEAAVRAGGCLDLGSRGQTSGCDTETSPIGRRALQDLDATEEALLAVRAEVQTRGQDVEEHLAVFSVFGIGIGGDHGLAESAATGGEEPRAASVGEEAVVADAYEALGEDVEQEAPREVPKGERERSSAPAAVVLEAERDALVVDVKQPVVGDRDAVRVAGEIGQNVLGAVEGGLGVDDPLGAAGLVEEALERSRTPVPCEAAMELQPTFSERVLELCHELAAEEAAEHTHGEEEARAAGLPSAPIVGQATRWDHTVHVRMVNECLAPGVEDGEEPEAGAEVAWVLGDLLKRLGRRAQQQVVDDPRVLESERRQRLRQGEHHVRVGHGQHLGLARLEPAGLRAALTLRAVTVATRVVRDPPVPAGVALVDVTTQPCRPAR